ncbi:MAG: PD40 domain-containing protein, partial [Bryobacterales bacterium]|nr:PD40 domain-containing protein [Bryobacterales bacterium]
PAISRDGKLVAYASDRAGDGKLDIYVQQLSGGDPVRLTRDPSDDLDPDFSPDGTMVAFHSDRQGGGIYMVPTLGGEERLVARLGRRPRFSPDGQSIVYYEGDFNESGAVYIVPAQGGERRRVAADIQPAVEPIWSPDGTRILFSTLDLLSYITPVEGGPSIRTSVGRHATEWLPGRVMGGEPHLWEADDRMQGSASPGGRQRWITNGSGFEAAPRLSPSGKLVFASRRNSTDLWRLDLDSNSGKSRGEPRQVTSDPLTEYGPSVSRNGKLLAYSVGQSIAPSLVRVRDLETGKETTLASENSPGLRSRISPDGMWVGYNVSRDNSLHAVNSRTGERRKLCANCGTIYGWSPDSSRIVFYKGSPIRFHTIGLDGGISDLISDPKRNIHGAEMSPDGRWLAFHVPLTNIRHDLFITPLHNGQAGPDTEWIVIARDEYRNSRPWWSADSNLLYFLSNRDGFWCIWARRLDPARKTPAGAPFEVQPFHSARGSSSSRAATFFGPAAARDFLVYSLGDKTANVWVGEPRK